jgi:hypothetical protein
MVPRVSCSLIFGRRASRHSRPNSSVELRVQRLAELVGGDVPAIGVRGACRVQLAHLPGLQSGERPDHRLEKRKDPPGSPRLRRLLDDIAVDQHARAGDGQRAGHKGNIGPRRPSTSPRRRPSADNSQQAASLSAAAPSRNALNWSSVQVVSSRCCWAGRRTYWHGLAARRLSWHACVNAALSRPIVSRTLRAPSRSLACRRGGAPQRASSRAGPRHPAW